MRVTAEALPIGKLMAVAKDSLYFDDLSTNLAENNPLRQTFEQWGAVSVIVIPLQTQRQWLGAVVVEADRVTGRALSISQLQRLIEV